MKYQTEILIQIVAALLFIPVTFSIFFLAISTFSHYILPVIKNKQHRKKMNKEIRNLIRETKGKFFSITFEKKDGTIRTINGKDKYLRLIRGGGSPATDALKAAGYVSAVNRNKETWFSFQPDSVVTFKCGKIEKTFLV